MKRGFAPSIFISVVLVASACSGTQHHPQAAGAHPAPSPSSGNPLKTTVQYSGVFDEKIHEDYSGQQLVKSMNRHLHFSFRESTSLTTPASVLARPINGTNVISDSVDNPLTFQLSGTVSEQDSPDVAGGQSCEATLAGETGLGGWTQATGRPPVEIAIAALNPDGTAGKTYSLRISAEVPTTGPQARVIHVNVTKAGGTFCQQTGVLDSQAVQASPDCIKFAAPGPTDANFLILPLDTQNYRKTLSCDKTLPYRMQGITGTDIVSGSGTLTINAAGGNYVSLGDSFSSGNFPPFEDDACERSTGAYPELYDSKGVFLACSGYASTAMADLVDQIPPTAKVISLTAGGDDINLFLILEQCLYQQKVPIFIGYRCEGLAKGFETDAEIVQQFETVASNLGKLFRKIKEKAPDAKVYILGYPDPLPVKFAAGTCPGLEDVNFAGHKVPFGVWSADLDFFNTVFKRTNTVIAVAAQQNGVTYIPPDPAFDKHNICSVDPWFFPLTAPDGEPAHPNGQGHRVMEQELFTYAGPAPD